MAVTKDFKSKADKAFDAALKFNEQVPGIVRFSRQEIQEIAESLYLYHEISAINVVYYC